MENRQPTPGQENRVLVIPETDIGLEVPNFYARIIMADNPLKPGTPWAKEAVLTDETASIAHLGVDATPNDMFSALAGYLAGNYKEYVATVSTSAWSGDSTNGYTASVQISTMTATDAMVFVTPEYSAESETRRQQMLSLSCVNQVKIPSGNTVQLIAFNKQPPYDFSIRLGVIERL